MSNAKHRLPPISDEAEARIQAGIVADPDAREATDEELARMRPASEVLPPALFAALTKRGRPKADAPKVAISLRVDPAVLEAYKATGEGWQTRMQVVLAEGASKFSGSYEVIGPRGGSSLRRSPGSKKSA